MKNKFLRLDKPCSENWENMTPNEKGRFCDSCSKSVIDFTKMTTEEITQALRESKGSICGRTNQRQLNTPLMDVYEESSFKLPYSRIAAGVMIAGSLAAVTPSNAEKPSFPIEMIDSDNAVDPPIQLEENGETPRHWKYKDTTLIKGKIQYDTILVENAIVIFLSKNEYYKTVTQKDGTFELPVPTHLIDKDNVILVSYAKVSDIEIKGRPMPLSFRDQNYLLSKEQIAEIVKITPRPDSFLLGAMTLHDVNYSPIVLRNGIEIPYKQFEKERRNSGEYCSSSSQKNNQSYITFYLGRRKAAAILGREPKDGLYLQYSVK